MAFVSAISPQPAVLLILNASSEPSSGSEESARSFEVSELTRLLAAHDETAFRRFHELYFDRLYQFLLVVLHGQEHEAREALQETLLRVARSSRTFCEEAAFWHWLKAIARNAAYDRGRKHRRYLALLDRFWRKQSVETPRYAGSPEAPLAGLLTEELSELSPLDRSLLEQKYVEGMPTKELAGATGLTEKAVESRLGRLRQQLRARLLRKLNAL